MAVKNDVTSAVKHLCKVPFKALKNDVTPDVDAKRESQQTQLTHLLISN